jgi:hypothetical protein
MRQSLPQRDPLWLRSGAAKQEAGRAFGFVKIRIPQAGQPVPGETFSLEVDQSQRKAAPQRDGHHLLRSHLWCCGRAMSN